MAAQVPDDQQRQPRPAVGRGILLLRYALPAAVIVAGAIVMSLGSESELEGGAGIAGAGIAIFAMNWLIRASTEGDRERDREEAARDYYAAHGRWPDEASAGEQGGALPGTGGGGVPAPGGRAPAQRNEHVPRTRTRGPRHR
jgi:hypothetical protein